MGAKKPLTPEQRAKRKLSQKAFYDRNRDRIREKNNISQKKRYHKDPARTKELYEKNKEKVNARRIELRKIQKESKPKKIKEPTPTINQKARKAELAKIWYEENRERILEKARQRYKENRNVLLEKTRQWKRDNPDKVAEHKKKGWLKKKDQTDYERLQTIIKDGTYYTEIKQITETKPKQKKQIEYVYYTQQPTKSK